MYNDVKSHGTQHGWKARSRIVDTSSRPVDVETRNGYRHVGRELGVMG